MLSHLGPGLTNAATGVANAALDSIPMVVIAGDVPTHYYGKHPHQEVNLHADAVAVRDLPAVRQARLARRSARPLPGDHRQGVPRWPRAAGPGRCWSSVPMDIFSDEVDVALFERAARTTRRRCTSPRIDEATAEQIVQRAARGAKRPVIYVGGGVLLADAADELREFAEHLGIPVAHSLMGKGALPDDHPLTLGHDRLLGHASSSTTSAATPTGSSALGTRFARGRLQLVGRASTRSAFRRRS